MINDIGRRSYKYHILWVYKEVFLQLLWKPELKKLTFTEMSIIGGKKVSLQL